ncbi:hypothetical protein [Providencia sp.]|uniref:hypothetical protein n=1 Tax=Providencia sp. TaxID=589 RepID=UPI003F955492
MGFYISRHITESDTLQIMINKKINNKKVKDETLNKMAKRIEFITQKNNNLPFKDELVKASDALTKFKCVPAKIKIQKMIDDTLAKNMSNGISLDNKVSDSITDCINESSKELDAIIDSIPTIDKNKDINGKNHLIKESDEIKDIFFKKRFNDDISAKTCNEIEKRIEIIKGKKNNDEMIFEISTIKSYLIECELSSNVHEKINKILDKYLELLMKKQRNNLVVDKLLKTEVIDNMPENGVEATVTEDQLPPVDVLEDVLISTLKNSHYSDKAIEKVKCHIKKIKGNEGIKKRIYNILKLSTEPSDVESWKYKDELIILNLKKSNKLLNYEVEIQYEKKLHPKSRTISTSTSDLHKIQENKNVDDIRDMALLAIDNKGRIRELPNYIENKLNEIKNKDTINILKDARVTLLKGAAYQYDKNPDISKILELACAKNIISEHRVSFGDKITNSLSDVGNRIRKVFFNFISGVRSIWHNPTEH